MSKKELEKKLATLPYPKTRRFHHISFKHAYEGIKWAFNSQPNFKIHTIAFSLLIFATAFFSFFSLISTIEIIVLLLCSAMVFTAEMVNTAVESLSDEVAKNQYKDFIRIAKDTSSGAVLVSVFFSLSIAFIIFIPKLIFLLNLFYYNIYR